MKRSRLDVGAKSRERGSTFAKPRQRPKRTVDRHPGGTHRGVWLLALTRDEGRCLWCRYEGREVSAEHPHHLLPKAAWPQYRNIAANIACLCGRCHMQHEFSPRDRLPWAALPALSHEFLTAVALVDARAARLIAVKYPKVNEREL